MLSTSQRFLSPSFISISPAGALRRSAHLADPGGFNQSEAAPDKTCTAPSQDSRCSLCCWNPADWSCLHQVVLVSINSGGTSKRTDTLCREDCWAEKHQGTWSLTSIVLCVLHLAPSRKQTGFDQHLSSGLNRGEAGNTQTSCSHQRTGTRTNTRPLRQAELSFRWTGTDAPHRH